MDYIIGAGAILTTGENGSITPATLHARVEPALAEAVRVAAIDFEGVTPQSIRRLLVLAQGWDGGRFKAGVTNALFQRKVCDLSEVLATLAEAAGSTEVHLFAHWQPDEATLAELATRGLAVVCHPLEAIESAALIAGQRHRRWVSASAA